jgi:hypothetical protein
MSKEQLVKCKKEGKTCLDCLHCKVCANSAKHCLMCFCAKTKLKERYLEPYWLTKPICKKFDDMSA